MDSIFFRETNVERLNWCNVSASANGKFLLATRSTFGELLRSGNGGKSWEKAFPSRDNANWGPTGISGCGQYQLVSEVIGSLYRSIDYGFSWQKTNASQGKWSKIAISAQG
jgi:photosystem II stability/assembly factor-like uncharacterized protein